MQTGSSLYFSMFAKCFSYAFHQAQETDRGESKKGAKEDEVEEDISDDSD